MPITQPLPTPLTTGGRQFIFGREAVAYGTAAVTTIQEPVLAVDLSPQRDTVDDTGQAGAASDVHGIDEATHYEQFTVRISSRPNGFVGYIAAGMMGPQTDAPVGTVSPWVHTIAVHPTSNILNSYTCYYKASSEGTATKQFLACMPTSLHLTFTQNAELAAEVLMWSQWPSNASMPTPTTRVGATGSQGTGAATDAVRLISTAGTYTLIGSSGAAYNTRVLSGDVTLTRPLEVVQDSTQKTPYYIKAGNLAFSGNLVVVFEGYGANTVDDDFRSWKAGGTTATPNKLRWTGADGTYIELVSYPWHLTAWSLDHSGQFVKANLSFRAYNDPSQVYLAAPILTVCSVGIANSIGTAMVAP